MGIGRFIGEKLHNLRNIGQKVAHGVRVAGNKLGGWMLSAAAPVAAFNPALGADMVHRLVQLPARSVGLQGVWRGFLVEKRQTLRV
jgi:hypothetical protein